MVVITTPRVSGAIDDDMMAAAIQHGFLGYNSDGWIVPSTESVLAASHSDFPNADGPLEGFRLQYWRTDDLQIQIHTGEAFIGGRYVGSDDYDVTEEEQATGDQVQVHEVSLPPNSQDVRVSLGVDTSQPNRIVIDHEENVADWPDDWPTVPLFQFDIDEFGVIQGSIQDLRPTDRRVNVTATNALNAVSAKDTQRFGYATADKYARTDQRETFDQALGFNGQDVYGELDSADGELFRIGIGFTDVVFHHANGAGRFQIAYNAERKNGAWRVINPSENCSILAMNSSDPGLNGGAIVAIGGFEALGKNLDRGDAIEFDWVGWDQGKPFANKQRAALIPKRPDAPDPERVPDGTVALYFNG